MKNIKAVMLSVAKHLGVVAALVVSVQAEEIRFAVGTSNFVADTLSGGQNFEALKFILPEIPQGSRIDFAGLVMYVQREAIDSKDTTASPYLSLSLVPITSDWTAGSVKNGQVLSVDSEWASYAVADMNMGDKVELDITELVRDWLNGKKANKGFMLVPEFADEKAEFAVKSNVGVKAEVVIYYTGPEVVKE